LFPSYIPKLIRQVDLWANVGAVGLIILMALTAGGFLLCWLAVVFNW